MKVKDLKPTRKVDYLRIKIISLAEVKRFRNSSVQAGRGQDDTGTVDFALFGKDTGRFGIGASIVIKNGYCKFFRDNLQIEAGKLGRIEKFNQDAESGDDPEDLSMFDDTEEEKGLREKLKDFGVDEI